MSDITVNTGQSAYDITLTDSFAGLVDAMEKNGLAERPVCLVTDSNVNKLYASAVADRLSLIASDVHVFSFKAGEKSKNLDVLSDCYRFLMEKKLDRGSVIVALGGGVTGDLAGFAAATYLRGIPFVQVPTTLLAQVDASVGGKVGVDFGGCKNMVGAFYQPRLVYINVRTLETLPAVELHSGVSEAIKHGLIADLEYFNFIEENRQGIKALNKDALIKLIQGSCRIKAAVVSQDEKETGLREILNFGHTFGHAVETLSDFSIPHGHCVGLGVLSALYLSQKRGTITDEDIDRVKSLYSFFQLKVAVKDYADKAIYNQMLMDKKIKNGKLTLILLEKFGKAYRCDDTTEEDVLWAVSKISKL